MPIADGNHPVPRGRPDVAPPILEWPPGDGWHDWHRDAPRGGTTIEIWQFGQVEPVRRIVYSPASGPVPSRLRRKFWRIA
jgi:hypothetical protein